jgi:hypothetical protein
MRKPQIRAFTAIESADTVYQIWVPDEWVASVRFWRLRLVWWLIKLLWAKNRPPVVTVTEAVQKWYASGGHR